MLIIEVSNTCTPCPTQLFYQIAAPPLPLQIDAIFVLMSHEQLHSIDLLILDCNNFLKQHCELHYTSKLSNYLEQIFEI